MRNAVRLISVMLILFPVGSCSRITKISPARSDTATYEKATNGESRLIVEASSALKNYCDLESNQNYEMIYRQLSEHNKKSLVRFQVRSASQYKKFRDSSEARWSEFIFDKKSLDGSKAVVFEGHAKIEESGNVESVSFRARLVQENGVWKIDDWKY